MQRLAEEGYLAVAPDLYHRFGDGITFGPEDRDAMMQMLGRLSDDMVLRDTEGVLTFLDGDARAADAPLGCIGFCMGGRFVVRAVSAFPERFAAGAALHPTALLQEDAPDSPHIGLARATAELYFGFGGADAMVPPAHQDAVREQVRRTASRPTIDIHDERRARLHAAAARAIRRRRRSRLERTLDLFGRALRATNAALLGERRLQLGLELALRVGADDLLGDWPFLKRIIVGIERTSYWAAVSWFSSTLSLTTCRSSRSSAISSSTGATTRHGPHQGAQKSTSTGLSDSRTSAWKFASVTSLERCHLVLLVRSVDLHYTERVAAVSSGAAAAAPARPPRRRSASVIFDCPPAVAEDDRHLDDAEAGADRAVGQLDLERVALRAHARAGRSPRSTSRAEALEAAGEVADVAAPSTRRA